VRGLVRPVGPRRTDSAQNYVQATRVIGALSVLILGGAIASDVAKNDFWSHHTLLTSLVASLIVVVVTAAVLNEVLEGRQRQRWAVLAQYALLDFVRTARLVWSSLLEVAGLVPDAELGPEALAAGSEAVHNTARLAAAMQEVLASPDRREQLHRLLLDLVGRGQDVLGRWADVMLNSSAYAEIVDRHVELYSRLYWWSSVFSESEPLDEHLTRPKLSRVSPATLTAGPIEGVWLRDNLVAIAELAESLDRASFELAMHIVSFDWWATRLPDRIATGAEERLAGARSS
jgi:hypothetical protein